MALNAATCAVNLTTAYRAAAALNADDSPKDEAISGDFATQFATHYDNYAQAGVVPGAANHGGNKALLETFLSSQSLPVTSTWVTEFATALANYWATVAVTPDAPAHGGTSVVSVVNDAATKIAVFEAAIRSCITQSKTAPYFQAFIAAIELAVKTITWTVTELVGSPPAPTAFVETIA